MILLPQINVWGRKMINVTHRYTDVPHRYLGVLPAHDEMVVLRQEFAAADVVLPRQTVQLVERILGVANVPDFNTALHTETECISKIYKLVQL